MLPLTTGFMSVFFNSADFVSVPLLRVGDFSCDEVFFDSPALTVVASFPGGDFRCAKVFFELACFDTAASLTVGDFIFDRTFLASADLEVIASLLRVGDFERFRVEFLDGGIVLLDFVRGDLVAKCPVPFMTPFSLWFLGDDLASLALWRSNTNFCPSTGVGGSLGIPIK